MTFSWEINLGQIIQAVMLLFGAWGAVLRIYHMLDKRMDKFEGNIAHHATTLGDHASRMSRYENQITTLVGDMQRIIGRMEILSPRWTGKERRGST